MTLLVVLALSATLGEAQPRACTPEECLRRINALAPIQEVALPDSGLPGEYTGGDGLLSGRTLYIFADHTYIYCEWADIEPLTIYDKGSWSLVNRILAFKADADVSWKQRLFDRRHMAIRLQASPRDVRLVGVDDELAFAEDGAKHDGSSDGYLRFISFTRKRPLKPEETTALRARLLKEAWRPDYFRK